MPASDVGKLARAYGVQDEYVDASRQRQRLSPERLLPVLRSLGAAVERLEDACDAARVACEQIWRQGIEPVIVAWEGQLDAVLVRLAESRSGCHGCLCTLEFEEGTQHEWWIDLAKAPLVESRRVEGVYYTARRLSVPCSPLMLGYHRLRVEVGPERLESMIIAAPRQAHAPADGAVPTWGLFAPLYALHRPDCWGSGDFTDLEQLLQQVRTLGGGVVATLPLLAAMLDQPFEPSPYAPASRLFWNEFYLDVGQVPEFRQSAASQQTVDSEAFQRELANLRASDLVDYRRGMALKRQVLEPLSQEFMSKDLSIDSSRRSAFQRYVAGHPDLESYAEFRAAGERFGRSWHTWPAAAREGRLGAGDYDLAARDYHLYVQWLCHQAIDQLAGASKQQGLGLYLDLPVGVSSDSFDVWRYRSVYATDLSVGCPPDPVFPAGQNWGFPPLHPHELRRQGYAHLRAYLRHHMQMAGMLRIDHVMGLLRLYCIPRGADASEGAYVRYHSEELFAVFCLESHRHQTVLVGEDLGTVPPEIPQAMQRHQLRRMYVMQYEVQPQAEPASVFAGAVAALNTHDMPPFAAFCQSLDVDERLKAGILSEEQARAALADRRIVLDQLSHCLLGRGAARAPVEIRDACLKFLATSEADVVIANIEDLWNATQSQNLPGTWGDWPNWRRKLAYPWRAALAQPDVFATLQKLHQWRQSARCDREAPEPATSYQSAARMATVSAPNSM